MTATELPRIVPETPFFCSWSGGKDCCLALELSAEAGARGRVRRNLSRGADVDKVDSRSVFSEDRLRG
jgi:hypothetical protein